jgi:SEA/GATOR complex protein SEA4/MIOS
VAFSQFDPNYLAIGLEKIRGEPSLVIWDIETLSSSVPKGSDRDQGAFKRPDTLLPRSVRGDKNNLQQWAHTETVTSLAFLPHTTSLLVAGVSHKWLRLFDLRVNFSPTNPLSASTKSIDGISVDPFDPNRIACFGDDGAVRIWDCRRLTFPLLTYTERDAVADGANPRGSSAISGIEFSSSRRGTLATLAKDAVVVRFWDTIRVTFPEEHDTPSIRHEPAAEEISSSKISKLARLPWSSSATESQTPVITDKQTIRGEQIVLRNTRTCELKLKG